MRWVGHVAYEANKKCILNFGQKTWRERPVGRPKHE